MAGKKAFGSQSDKRTKAGKSNHAQVDGVKMFNDTVKGLTSLFGGKNSKMNPILLLIQVLKLKI